MRILHIDDDADDRGLFLAAIKRVDPSIFHLEASGGEEAYAMLLSDHLEHIDCIFLDINMPAMDGITLLRLLIIGSVFPEKLIFEKNGFRTNRVNEAVRLICMNNSELDQKKSGRVKKLLTTSAQVGVPGLPSVILFGGV